MENHGLSESLSDKVYEIKTDDNNMILQLTSYFPLSESEKAEIQAVLGAKFSSGRFHSIFTDVMSEEEWSKNKIQIKKRFQNELFDID